MSEYSSFPPIDYLKIVIKNCPKTALLYIQLWEKSDDQCNLTLDRNEVRDQFHITPTLFRNLCHIISAEGLISFKESKKKFTIDLVGYDA